MIFEYSHSDSRTIGCAQTRREFASLCTYRCDESLPPKGETLVENGRFVWRTIPSSELISVFAKTMPCRPCILLRHRLSIGGDMRILREMIMEPFLNVFRQFSKIDL